MNNSGQVGITAISFKADIPDFNSSANVLLLGSTAASPIVVQHNDVANVEVGTPIRINESGDLAWVRGENISYSFSSFSPAYWDGQQVVVRNPDWESSLDYAGLSLNDSGDIAVLWVDNDSGYGNDQYLSIDNDVIVDNIYDFSSIEPYKSYSYYPYFGGPAMNSGGTLAMSANGGTEVYLAIPSGGNYSNELLDSNLSEETTSFYTLGDHKYTFAESDPTGHGFARYGDASAINSGGVVAYHEAINDGESVFNRLHTGYWTGSYAETAVIAEDGDETTSELVLTSVGLAIDINDAAEVYFNAETYDDRDVLVKYDGADLVGIAITPTSSWNVVGYEMNEGGIVSYELKGPSGTSGIYISDGIDTLHVATGEWVEVTGTDLISQSPPNDPDILTVRYGGLNDFGQVSYLETITELNEEETALIISDESVRVFTPDLYWNSTSSGAWKTYSKWTLGLVPGYGPDLSGLTAAPNYRAIIDPDSGNVSVTMPSENVSVKSLQIGGTESYAVNLQLAASKTLIAIDGVTVESNGTIGGSYSGGTSTIAGDVTNDGDIYPGGNLSIGSLVVSSGDFAQSSTGKLTFEIADNLGFPSLDTLTVDGTIDLDGTLEIILAGYTPTLYETFDIIFAGTLGSGEFDTVIGSVIGNAYVPEFDVIYNTGADKVTVQYVGIGGAIPEPGVLALLMVGVLGLSRRSRH